MAGVDTSSSSFHHYEAVIADITALKRRPWHVSISNVLCEANTCANQLAHLRVSQDRRLIVVEEPPSVLAPFLLADAMGMTFMLSLLFSLYRRKKIIAYYHTFFPFYKNNAYNYQHVRYVYPKKKKKINTLQR